MNAKRLGETSYKETAFGIIPRSRLIPLEIEGIKRAWDFVLQQRKQRKISLTPNSIKEMHKIGFGWIFPKAGGKFRQVEVTVSGHIPPKYYLITELMDNYCKDLQARLKHLLAISSPKFLEEITELLAWAQHRFLWIHPFLDYNGRIGRLLTNVILLNLDLPPIELKVESVAGRKKYIRALQFADQGNLTELQKLVKAALVEAAQNSSKLNRF